MDDFRALTDEEFHSLSNKDRREYLKKKKEYDNKKLVEDTAKIAEIDAVPSENIAVGVTEQAVEQRVAGENIGEKSLTKNETEPTVSNIRETVEEGVSSINNTDSESSPMISKINLSMKPVKKERTNNTRSFYLKDETYNKLVSLAKRNNVGISEYLEFILGQIL